MLDVCRHYVPIDYIYKFIDLLAMNKMNVFHWHLTDDQGWRIEIKKYPKLTEIGSKREKTLVDYYYVNYPQVFDGEDMKDITHRNKSRMWWPMPQANISMSFLK